MKSCHALLGAAKQFHTNYLFVGILPVIGPFFNQTHSPRGRLLSKAWLNIICFHLQRKIFEEVWRLLLWIEFCWAQDFVLLWVERIKLLPCWMHCQTEINWNIFQMNIVRFVNWFAEGASQMDSTFSTPFQFLTPFSVLTNYSIGVFPGIIYTCSWCIPDGDKMCIICQHHAT